MNNVYKHETYPLSPLQKGMLFHSLASVGTGVDIQQIICGVHEQLDVEAFQRAWARVVERHAVLRSRFEWEEISEPRQVVIPEVSFKGECFDWKHLSRREQEESLETYIQKDRAQGFDIVQVPLMRLAIFKFGDEEYKFIWTFHHILLDGRAFPLILEEVFTFYEAFIGHRDAEMGDPRPYKDYVLWVRERDLAKDEKFWRENLAGFTSPTPLVVGAPLVAEKRALGSGGSVVVRIPGSLTSTLRNLASSNGLSLNTLVEGAWALLLSRYSDSEDILYGTTHSCRRASIEGAESIIGPLINTVPMRVTIRKQTKMIDWLKQLRKQHIEMRQYIHSPLYDIQRWSDITPGSPLFESLVVFENYVLNSHMQSKGGRWVKREFEYRGRTNYPLTLVGYDDDEMILKIDFDEGRFTQDAVKRMLGHLQSILQSLPGSLDTCVAEIPILTESERHQLLVAWNATQADYPRDKFIHELFEDQVERTPDAVALIFEDQRLTYRELNRRANQLAHYLREFGVGPEVLVGICVERSLEMVVGLLGILKAGGVYVPLDPAYPKERLAFMLEDSAPVVLLTQGRYETLFTDIKRAMPVIDLSSKFHAWMSQPVASPDHISVGLTPENLANVLYTSGSTGKPKGVGARHRGLQNLLPWYIRECNLSCSDAVLVVTSHSYDLTQRNIFGPLLVGARLVLAREPFDPQAIVALVAREHISTMNLPPSAFHSLIAVGTNGELSELRLVILGGEPVQPSRLLELPEPRPEFINGYGPTECTGIITFHRISPDLQRYRSGNLAVPIGRPIPNTRIYILDSYKQPVPIGVVGEIYIGGVPVGRGYLNRPELTAERFVSDPFSTGADARIYKTGDLARWSADGTIELLGRNDFQVKIRGFRIELGDIEAKLAECPAVRDAAVLAHEDKNGDKLLVAYLVAQDNNLPSVSELRDFLKTKIPEFMVPSVFVTLETMPLTPNGKLDRRALPAPDHNRPQLGEIYIAPRTPVEKALASIWTEVLGAEKVGVNDNFFELGGSSLLAVRLFVRIRKWAGVDLPLVILLKTPTVRALAEFLDPNRATVPISRATSSEISSPIPEWRSLVPIKPEGNRLPVFLVHAVGGNVLNYLPLLHYLGPDQPLYGLQARGVDGVLPAFSSIEEMASHYIAEIRSVQSSGPYFLGGASFGGTVAFEIAQQLTQQGEKVAALALFDSIGPGAFGFRYSRTSLRMRLVGIQRDAVAEQASLPLYLSKRLYQYLSNRICTLRLGFFSLTERPIPLELREEYLTRNHNSALQCYAPRHYFGPITLFRGPAGNWWPYNDPELGWKDIASGGLKIITVPAPHLEFMDSPELGVQYAKELRAAQDKAQGAGLIINHSTASSGACSDCLPPGVADSRITASCRVYDSKRLNIKRVAATRKEGEVPPNDAKGLVRSV